MPPEYFIELKNISKKYGGVQALTDINLTLRPGEAHCLCGQNGSGKSTLIKIIAGVESADAGSEIRIDGSPRTHLNPVTSTKLGIQVIYQDLSLFPNMSIAENISIGLHLGRLHCINKDAILQTALKAMASIGVSLDPHVLVSQLDIAQRQLVAICRAIAADAKLVIMDEPTASLTRHEVNALIALTRQLKARGVAVIFVSHRLDEVMEVAERVTVLRDGVSQGCFDSKAMTDSFITRLMTGHEYSYTPRKVDHSTAPIALRVRNLCRASEFKNITMDVRAGEILGITGLLGSGRTELALSLFGMNKQDSGAMEIFGRSVSFASNRDAIRQGVAYLAEDRLALGLVVNQSIETNILLSVLDKIVGRFGLIQRKKQLGVVEGGIASLQIKTKNPKNAVSTLSGGNQQRVVLSKWLATNPKILILDSPTVGVDVSAKDGIYEVIKELAKKGLAVIMISDEVSEVLNHSDRVLVMKKGQISNEFVSTETTEKEIQEAVDA